MRWVNVMVPVDGGYPMGQADMLAVPKTIKARIVIPMHYFGPTTLNRFIGTMGQEFELEVSTSPERIVSVNTLPDSPKLLVLPGYLTHGRQRIVGLERRQRRPDPQRTARQSG